MYKKPGRYVGNYIKYALSHSLSKSVLSRWENLVFNSVWNTSVFICACCQYLSYSRGHSGSWGQSFVNMEGNHSNVKPTFILVHVFRKLLHADETGPYHRISWSSVTNSLSKTFQKWHNFMRFSKKIYIYCISSYSAFASFCPLVDALLSIHASVKETWKYVGSDNYVALKRIYLFLYIKEA